MEVLWYEQHLLECQPLKVSHLWSALLNIHGLLAPNTHASPNNIHVIDVISKIKRHLFTMACATSNFYPGCDYLLSDEFQQEIKLKAINS